MVDDKLVEKFTYHIMKKNVVIKNNNLFQGRKAFNGQQAAEEYLGVIDEDLKMSYELIEKAKRLLEQKQKENKVSFIPQVSTIPELYSHTTKDGVTSFWIKRSPTSNEYTRLAHDEGNLTLLAKAISKLITDDTKEKLFNILDRLKEENPDTKENIISLIISIIENNGLHKLNTLKEVPKGFTTNPKTPTVLYIDISNIPTLPKPTPAWDSLTNRMVIEETNLKGSDYFKAFIWSVFEENDRNRVFLYWYDEGNQGKSEVMNILKNEVLKDAATAFDFTTVNSHSAESLVGTRLIIQNEAVVKKLTSVPIVKQITGHDDVVINPKGKRQYSLPIDAKIMALSNTNPIVSSQGSELSRLLPIKNLPRTKEHYITNFREKLKNELLDFLGSCRIVYNELKKIKQIENFLSIETELSKTKTFLDYSGQLIEILEDTYTLESSPFGSKWKKIQTVVNKIIEEDDSLKGNVTSASPQLLDFLSKWAKQHGGKFIRIGANKGFEGLMLIKKETLLNTKQNSDIDL
jgi:hypothetical protein